MKLLKKIQNSTAWIKWTRWEYWPVWLFNIPVALIWCWFALCARHLFFFSAVNPAIRTGGLLDASKRDILNRFPQMYLPVTAFIPGEKFHFSFVRKAMADAGLTFPVVLKPDTGERGKRVEKIDDEGALRQYLQGDGFDLLLQEYVDLPEEMSVFYHRLPGAEKGAITSICVKEKLAVTGDGKRSMRELLDANPRARFQMQRLIARGKLDPEGVPDMGERILLEPIGNHCRGTRFMDGGHLYSAELMVFFDRLMNGVEGLHYGRFDFKYHSMEELVRGEQFKILEFNGVASEPAHVYGHSLWYAYGQYYKHWEIMYRIYRAQRKRGNKPMDWSTAFSHLRNHFKHQKKLSARNTRSGYVFSAMFLKINCRRF